MILKEFAEEHHLTPAAVTKYISEHSELFEGHIAKEGKCRIPDEIAVKALEEHFGPAGPYVLPQAYVEELHDLQQQLISCQHTLIKTMGELALAHEEHDNTAIQIAELQRDKGVAETVNAGLCTQLSKAEEALAAANARAAEAEAEAAAAKEEADRLRNRGLFARIFNRK